MPEGGPSRSTVVSQFIRRFREAILTEWMRRDRGTPAGQSLSEPLLRDHMPQLLDDLAASVDDRSAADLPNARHHAIERLAEGFDITSLVDELSLLRTSMLAIWRREQVPGSLDDIAVLDRAVDHAIAVSVSHYVEALRSERERALAKLESLLAASPIGIAFVDRDLRYLRINDALAKLNGRSVADHVGHTVGEMLPEVAPQLEQLLRTVLDNGEALLNLEVMRPGATPADTRHLLANYFPVRGPGGVITGVGGIVLDVTDTKRAEQALRTEQARLQSIVEHAPAAIWVKDAAGELVLANHQLADALGHAYEQLLGRRSDDLLPIEFAAQHEEHDRIVLSENRSIEVEEVVPSPDGERIFLSIKFPIPGEPPLVGAIATEITERKRMEEELRIAVRTREDIMAVVSHDLRSPLGIVQLSATLLMSQLGTDHKARRHLDMIHRACSRMETLIDDLLDTASIREGRLEIDAKRELIEDVVTEAVDLQVPLAEEKNIAVVRDYQVEGIHVRCDHDRIIQVFANIIGNALKFCRAGDTITVSAERGADEVRFAIANTGPAIDPERLTRIFDAYWSAPEHRARGSGLGLYIVRGIIERHGGRIWAESRPGSGATFVFTLPIDREGSPVS